MFSFPFLSFLRFVMEQSLAYSNVAGRVDTSLSSELLNGLSSDRRGSRPRNGYIRTSNICSQRAKGQLCAMAKRRNPSRLSREHVGGFRSLSASRQEQLQHLDVDKQRNIPQKIGMLVQSCCAAFAGHA